MKPQISFSSHHVDIVTNKLSYNLQWPLQNEAYKKQSAKVEEYLLFSCKLPVKHVRILLKSPCDKYNLRNLSCMAKSIWPCRFLYTHVCCVDQSCIQFDCVGPWWYWHFWPMSRKVAGCSIVCLCKRSRPFFSQKNLLCIYGVYVHFLISKEGEKESRKFNWICGAQDLSKALVRHKQFTFRKWKTPWNWLNYISKWITFTFFHALIQV